MPPSYFAAGIGPWFEIEHCLFSESRMRGFGFTLTFEFEPAEHYRGNRNDFDYGGMGFIGVHFATRFLNAGQEGILTQRQARRLNLWLDYTR